jgi:hypothetical protein
MTYEIEVNQMSGQARYKRTGLPGPGNVGEQDGVLMETLEYLCAVHNRLLVSAPTNG